MRCSAVASSLLAPCALALGVAWPLKPSQFDTYIKEEIASNADVVKAAGLAGQQ